MTSRESESIRGAAATTNEEQLAIEGGLPVRTEPLPLEFPGVHHMDEEEVEAATRVLRDRSPFRYYGVKLGCEVEQFEKEFAGHVGLPYAVAVSSGTGALHTALSALGVGPGQEDRDFVAGAIQTMFSDHREFDFTKRIVRPDGEIHHVRWVGIPAPNGQGFVGHPDDSKRVQAIWDRAMSSGSAFEPRFVVRNVSRSCFGVHRSTLRRPPYSKSLTDHL